MTYTSRITFLPSLLRAANTYTVEMNLGYGDELLIYQDITAVGGTGAKLNTKFETADPLGGWYTHTVIPEKSGIAKDVISVPVFGDRVRITSVVSGTTDPTVTFSVTGTVKTR